MPEDAEPAEPVKVVDMRDAAEAAREDHGAFLWEDMQAARAAAHRRHKERMQAIRGR